MASILVIDDDVQIQDLINFVLEEAGHEVRCAGNGNAGLKAHRARPADLILYDLVMPEKEGLETIRELHREFSKVKIIAISGGDGKVFLPVAKKLGPVTALCKPLSPSDLTVKIDQVLRADLSRE